MQQISEIDLIINPDNTIYHLHLSPGEIADTIITVGDPGRVDKISKYLDRIEIKKNHREFITHTGFLGEKRISVVSTGISTDNIDIVLNELDAVANIDFETRLPNKSLKSLNLIRIGTSGSMQPDIPVDSLLVATEAFGLDTVMHYYHFNQTILENEMLEVFRNKLSAYSITNPYIASASKYLLQNLGHVAESGIALTTPGFFAAQGRQLRARNKFPNIITDIANFDICGKRITNFEMETAALYGLSSVLGHNAISFSTILANPISNVFSADPAKILDIHIRKILGAIYDDVL